MLHAMLLAASVLGAAGTPAEAVKSDVVTVELRDGSRLVGQVVEEDADRLRVRTLEGLVVEVSRASVAAIRKAGGGSRFAHRADPNYSRLMFGATGRPLRKGDGYFSDHELLFPGVAYGLSDHVSLAGGMSIIPGLDFGEQVAYFSPKVGFNLSDQAAVSVGGLLAGLGGHGDRADLGIAFGVATFGDQDKSVSLGFGLGRELAGDDGDTRPIVMVGGHVRLSDSIALVSENWLFLRDVSMSEQPFAVAVRFFGDRLSADVGMILIGEVLEDGLPIPWLSFSYHFGPSRSSRASQATPSWVAASHRTQ
jgi:hypothetical protein